MAFWENIKCSDFYYLVGGPHEILYAPLLYTYLLYAREKSSNISVYKHVILALGIYLIIHPIRSVVFKTSHNDIVPFYMSVLILFNICYFFMGVQLFKNELKNILKPYPRTRFLLFYISINSYLLIKAIIISFVVAENLLQVSSLSGFNQAVSIPAYQYVLIPTFILLCLTYFLYALTEINWFKKYFLSLSIHQQHVIDGASQKEIEAFLEKSKIYSNPNLSIGQFLRAGKFNRTDFKHFLEKNNYENFSEWINRLRVNDFKEKLRLKKYQNFDFYSIAQESGFKSKASFYRVFKILEGTTPGEYLRKINK